MLIVSKITEKQERIYTTRIAHIYELYAILKQPQCKQVTNKKTGNLLRQFLSVQKKSLPSQDYKNNIQMETFGEYIRQLRTSANLPIRKIAAQLDIDATLLGKIERDERPASKDVIAKIAKIFNQNEKDLFHRFLSDRIAYKIIDEDADINVLRVAEQKIEYLKAKAK